MPSVPELDIAAITSPIPGDNPGGSRLPFTTRQKLEAARKEFEPNPDDPSAAPIPKKPEWALIVRQASEVLAESSKDLETGLRLTEALTKIAGFAGMREGFKILRGLLENCWDYLHPIPDPGDGEGPEIRAERFNWIGDLDAGARFPHSVREVPFLSAAGHKLSMKDRAEALANRGEVSADDAARAVIDSMEVAAEFGECYEEFLNLDRVLNDKLGDKTPGMVGLRQVLDEIKGIIDRLAAAAAAGDAGLGSDADGDGGGGRANGSLGSVSFDPSSVRSREEAYRLIGQIADALERIEPHSPIPDLLRRALDLGRMPFKRLIRELIRDPGNLSQVYREFGIREDEVPSS